MTDSKSPGRKTLGIKTATTASARKTGASRPVRVSDLNRKRVQAVQEGIRRAKARDGKPGEQAGGKRPPAPPDNTARAPGERPARPPRPRRDDAERGPRRFGEGEARPPRGRDEGERFARPRRDDGERFARPRRDDAERAPRRFGEGEARPPRGRDEGERFARPRRDDGERFARPRRDDAERAPRRSSEGEARPPRGRDEGERFARPRRDDGERFARPRRDDAERAPRRSSEGEARPPRGRDEGERFARPRRDDGERFARPRRDDAERAPRRSSEGEARPPRGRDEGERFARPRRDDGERFARPRRDDAERAPRRFGEGEARPPRGRGEGQDWRRDDGRPAPTRERRFSDTGDRARPAPRPGQRAASHADARPRTASGTPAATRPEADDGGLVRLSKRMSDLGLCSRREADEWIPRGWVLVDGKPVTELGTRIRPDAEIEILQAARSEQGERVTVLINKPVGYVSGQAEDGYEPAAVLFAPENQWEQDPTRKRFAPWQRKNLAPAGRLDIDSTGLLVLTQDGRVARALIGDDSNVEKEYLVRVVWESPDGDVERNISAVFPPEQLDRLRHGLALDGVALKPAKVSWQNEEQLRFVLREGRKRQIRRMCEQVGLKVVGLKRVRMGRVVLGDLPPGQWRFLGPFEKF
ncbi:pseudouridine synthase [Cupriavidus sp. Marseille-Q8015]